MKHQHFVNFHCCCIGLLFGTSTVFFSITLISKRKEDDKYALLRRKLEAPHNDKFPGKFIVQALAVLSNDIYYVTGTSGSSDVVAPEAISWKEGWDFKYWVESDDGTEAMILESSSSGWGDSKNKITIVFRGMEEWDDLGTNIDYSKERSRFQNAPAQVEIHGGFQKTLFDNQQVEILTETLDAQVQLNTSIKTLLEQKLMQLNTETSELYVTGHSLG